MNRIIIYPCGGLCHRIQVVLSAHVLATSFNKSEVYVYNGPSNGFSDNTWESLFDYSVYSITADEYAKLKKDGILLGRDKPIHPIAQQFDQISPVVMSCEKDIVYEGSFDLFQSLSKNDQAYATSKYYNEVLLQEYRSLRPSIAVRDIMEQVEPFVKQATVGIHVRRGDAILGENRRQYLKSEDKHFDNYISNIVAREPMTKFYLATDDESVLNALVNKHKNRIIYLDKEFVKSIPGKPKGGQLEAAAELFLLSRTRRVIGTNFSAYSSAAAKIGNVPIVCPMSKDKTPVDVPSFIHGDQSPVSIVTGCMNRLDRLSRALPSWLETPNVTEIVIVDWSSDESLLFLAERDPRIRVIRVEGEKRWVASQAFNVAVLAASNKIILKVDVDYIIQKDFYEKHPMRLNHFYSGDWQHGRNISERFLMGLVFMYKSDFEAINGYNERIISYGWEDNDLYLRMEQAGVAHTICDLNTVLHIPHGDPLRICHQPEVETCMESVNQMQKIAETYIWGKDDQIGRFRFKTGNNRAFTCERVALPPKLFIWPRTTENWLAIDSEKYTQKPTRWADNENFNRNMKKWHKLWSHYPYTQYRADLKEIALRNWERAEVPYYSETSEFPPERIILLPLDDDDWIAPHIKHQLESVFLNPNIDYAILGTHMLDTIWGSSKPFPIDETTAIVPSCSYAIRASAATPEVLSDHTLFKPLELPKNKVTVIQQELVLYNEHIGSAWINMTHQQEDLPAVSPEVNYELHWGLQEFQELMQMQRRLRPRKNMSNRSKKIIVKPNGGIGNRLRTILSAAAIGDIIGADVLVYWAPCYIFEEKYENLFATPINMISKTEYETLQSQCFEIKEKPCREKILDKENILYDGNEEFFWLLCGAEQQFIIQNDYKEKYDQKYRTLVPTETVANLMTAVTVDKNMIGVHIRRGEVTDSKFWNRNTYLLSSEDAFHQAIEQELKKTSDRRFFLVTESQETLNRFVQKYDQKITTLIKPYYWHIDQSKHSNVAYWVADLFLLSQTERIFGNNYSSFSETAAKIGGIPLEVIRESEKTDTRRRLFI